MEKTRDQLAGTESRSRLVEQVSACLRSGDYARALDSLRASAAEFPNDEQLSSLEKLAQDGVHRSAEANRLITESQELFAQQKSAEAIQVLRKAYELDKKNSLARAILANALVEHANSLVDTDWLEAEKLTNQALAVNPAHPTAKTISNLIVELKKNSSVEDWVTHARKLQSSGDLFAALAWVAEGLAVHPDEPKLVQIHDAIQRDQGARRRQARRGDLDDLRRMELAIAEAADESEKQALAERIQAVAAKYWTDGEILSIANGLLNKLGLAPQESSKAAPRSKSAAVIFHVPRAGAPTVPRTNGSPAPQDPIAISLISVSETPPTPAAPEKAANEKAPVSEVPPSAPADAKVAPVPQKTESPKKPPLPPPKAATVIPAEPFVTAVKIPAPASQPKQTSKSNLGTLIVASVVATVLVAGTFFLARHRQASPVARMAPPAPAVSVPTPARAPAPPVTNPSESVPAPTTAESSQPDSSQPAVPTPEKSTPDNPPTASVRSVGTLVVVAGQDDVKVFLNGKLQRQLTQGGQLRVPNLELKDYVVQVSKNGFQDPPQQKVRIRKDEESRLTFSLQPQPHLTASLSILGGAPGTTVLVDQTPVGTIQPDGSLAVSTIGAGDHTIELRKDRFKPRQFKKHFVLGATVALVAADTALEPFPGEVKITFAPADANVAIVKGDLLKFVSSGTPLTLAPGTYTLTARTAERFTRSSTFEVIAGQSKTINLALAPNGMSKWETPGAWKQEKDVFTRKGGDFVLYGVVPAAGTFVFSAMPKGHMLQWVIDYTDSQNYILFQIDDNNFYRTVIHNGQKTNQVIVPDKGDKKSFRTIQIQLTSTGVIHQIKHGDSWTVIDRWSQTGTNLGQGKFGFYIPGNEQVSVSNFSHYADLNIR